MKQRKKVHLLLLVTFLIALLAAPLSVNAAAKTAISKKKATVYVEKSTTLKVTGTRVRPTWSSSNKQVAVVSKSGKVTGKKAGTAVITAKVKNQKYTCKVTVKNVIKASKTNLKIKNSTRITVYLYKPGTVYFKSSNPSVVTCKWKPFNGTKAPLYFYGQKNGTATVTLTNTYSKQKIKIKVTVDKGNPTPTPAPTPIPEEEVVINLPARTPIANYIGNNIRRRGAVTDVHYTAEKRYDGTYTVYLYFSGTMDWNYYGPGQSDTLKIGWKLYKNGAVVDSGIEYSPSLAPGESFVDTKEYIFNVAPGVYDLKLLSVN